MIIARTFLFGAAILALSAPMPNAASAGEADVVAVEATPMGGGKFRFDVAVRHADAGWKHYADRFEVLAPDGTVLGTRVLVHPHDNEQPFTRSLVGVVIPAGLARVTVRAHDKVHGYGGATMTIARPGRGS